MIARKQIGIECKPIRTSAIFNPIAWFVHMQYTPKGGIQLPFFFSQECEIKDFEENKMKQNNNNNNYTNSTMITSPRKKNNFAKTLDSGIHNLWSNTWRANVEWHENCEIDNDKFEEEKRKKKTMQRQRMNPKKTNTNNHMFTGLSNHTDTIANQFNTYSISFVYSSVWTIQFWTKKKKNKTTSMMWPNEDKAIGGWMKKKKQTLFIDSNNCEVIAIIRLFSQDDHKTFSVIIAKSWPFFSVYVIWYS